MKRYWYLLIMIGVLLLFAAGTVYGWHKSHAGEVRSSVHSSPFYLDKNGCAQSADGGVHPDYCVKQ